MTEYLHMTYDELCEHAEALRRHLLEVERLRDERCGAHPALIALHKGFDWPACDGGYSIEDVETDLGKLEGEWVLTVSVRYEHGDAPESPYEVDKELVVRDGRLMDVTNPSYKDDLADANDLEACKEAVKELLDYDGGY